MKYKDLRDFINQLEKQGQLKRITQPVDPILEMTEICDRTLRAGGPALLFENPIGHSIPVLANLFGTPDRVALAMGQTDVNALRDVGKLLAMPGINLPMSPGKKYKFVNLSALLLGTLKKVSFMLRGLKILSFKKTSKVCPEALSITHPKTSMPIE